MAPLRQCMLDDMQLRGLALKTQAAYALAVRQLAEHYGKSPPPYGAKHGWLHCQPVGGGRRALSYLAPYIFRVATTDRRLVALNDAYRVGSRHKSAS
jgi:hypothetical protein